MPKETPQRSCVACRATRDKGELLRFVLAPDRTLVPDLLQKLPGRGAYTCMKRSCLIQAAAKKQFARVFKGEVTGADGVEMAGKIVRAMEERIASYLALANKAGKVISGGDMVLDALRSDNRPGIVFVATDISPDIREKVAYLAGRSGASIVSLFDKERLGALIGKELRSVVAITASGFVETILKETERFRNFLDGGALENEQDPRL